MPFCVEFKENNDNFNIGFREQSSNINLNFGEIWTTTGETPEWDIILNKPFETIGENLKVENGILKVDTASEVERDNTRPITSAAVYTEIGNIETLLSLI